MADPSTCIAGANQSAPSQGERMAICNAIIRLGGKACKASVCNAGNLGSIPGSGRSSGEGNSNPLQYPCLENPMDRSLVGYSPQGDKESNMTERLIYTLF